MYFDRGLGTRGHCEGAYIGSVVNDCTVEHKCNENRCRGWGDVGGSVFPICTAKTRYST